MFPTYKFSAQSTHICIVCLSYVPESTKFNFFVVFFSITRGSQKQNII